MFLPHVAIGDIVDIVAPASRCSRAELQNGLRAVRDLGLVPRVQPELFSSERASLFSNRDEVRLRHLKHALYAPDSKLIWCVRGGYGALRLVPAMAKWKKPSRAKIVLGYSDITTLHSFFNSKWKWPTLHGPMVDRFGRGVMGARERRELLSLLFGTAAEVAFTVRPLNTAARRRGERRASEIVGGNMAVLQSSMGTSLQLNGRGRIVFFEDTGERPHRVDRMLEQFTQSGMLDGARAVVFGHFQLTEAKDRRQLWNDVIPRFVAAQKIPVFAGLPVGHSKKIQMTLPLGTPAVIGGNQLIVRSPIR